MLLYKRRPNRVYYLMKNKEKLRKFVTYCFINKSYEDIGILNEPNCSDIYAPGRDYPTPYLYFFPIVLHRFLAQKSKCGTIGNEPFKSYYTFGNISFYSSSPLLNTISRSERCLSIRRLYFYVSTCTYEIFAKNEYTGSRVSMSTVLNQSAESADGIGAYVS